MKIIVHKENFQRALAAVERVTSKNTTLPILGNVLLHTENGRLKLSATNLEVGIVSLIGAKIEKEGTIAVPGRILSDFVRSLQGETVTLSTEQNTLTVDSGAFKTTILCFDPKEYPIIPKVTGGEVRTIAVETLRAMVVSIADSIATTESRPELAGAFLQFRSDTTIMAATDGFRLAEFRTVAQNATPTTLIIPRATIIELSRLLSDVEGEIVITVSDNQVSFAHDRFEVVSRLVDGRYPDYQKIIPEKFLSKTLVKKSELEGAIKAASLFSSSIADIKIEGGEGSLTISAKSAQKGDAQAAIEANTKGDSFDVMVNYHYFLDGLKTIPTDKVVIEFTGRGSPFVLRPNDDKKELVYLFLPLRG